MNERINIDSYMEGQHDVISRIIHAFQIPSCFTCKHAFIISDPSVGIPPGLEECKKFPDKYPTLDGLYHVVSEEEEYASECGGWEPDWAVFVGY